MPLAQSVQAEVDSELAYLLDCPRRGFKKPSASCEFCHFRKFRNLDRLRGLIEKYHTVERRFIACSRTSAQWNILKAVYNQQALLTPLEGQPQVNDMLARSATLLAGFLEPDEASREYLQGNNDVGAVYVLTSSGPQYAFRCRTGSFRRVSNCIYYDSTFASLFLSLALKHNGKCRPVFTDLVTHAIAQGSQCALALPEGKMSQKLLLDDIVGAPEVDIWHQQLIDKATHNGEWSVLQHDATFKVLFSIIGQQKMAQKGGEYHAAHSFIGLTGAVAGLSLQHTEGRECFQKACVHVLPEGARATTRWVFSDTPASIEGCTHVLPQFRGVAEDAMHLVFRARESFGERSSSCTKLVKAFQSKFYVPSSGEIYNGEEPALSEMGVWNAAKPLQCRSDEKLAEYLEMPYRSHQEYVDDLLRVVQQFPQDMGRKSATGGRKAGERRTLLDILQAGANYQHYAYLLNGSIIRGRLSPAERDGLAWGPAAMRLCMHR